jgi:alkanesulfonate monooxygenase SsuD/methylene tetrahydromethanopterin reductase-like flavin-dependent oxidoreductase (luciferase family)
MDTGLFLFPAHPRGVDLLEATQWDLQVIRWADELGYSEAWIGEHFTNTWEPIPSPDLIIAQALLQTSTIRLAPGAHLLPFHHPAELAHRVAYLDHLSQGRLMLGIGAGSVPGDFKLFGVDAASGENRAMTAEALEMILRLWTDEEPFTMVGKYWTVSGIEEMYGHFARHMFPYQKPHPPIGVSGLSSPSPTLEMAGERGFIPMSLNLGTDYVKSHWDSVIRGAERTGLTPRRSQWRIAKEVFVADTDAEAYELSLNGPMGEYQREYLLDIYGKVGLLKYFKHDPEVLDSEVTPEYCAERNWIVGSPDTVAQKLESLYRTLGGFGTLLAMVFDYKSMPEAWHRSMSLLTEEVMPRLTHLDVRAEEEDGARV